MPKDLFIRALARAFLAGQAGLDEVAARAAHMLGRPWPWVRPLVERFVSLSNSQLRPRYRETVALIGTDRGFQEAWVKFPGKLVIRHLFTEAQVMEPAPFVRSWGLPELNSVQDVAEWLSVRVSQLLWFADLRGLGYKRSASKLRHYHCRLVAKRSGAVRLLEAPKSRLKELQRLVLAELLEKVPLHAAAHGFVKGRSIKSFAAPHVGRSVVLRMDLQEFFPTIGVSRVQTFFRMLGYPEAVADVLGGLATNASPRESWEGAVPWETERLYARPHLPQGAPTSPALANICCFRLDCRLDALAKACGANYTRYADDLAFSGGNWLALRTADFAATVASIAMEEGLAINYRKTRVMRQSTRQQLVGLVVNRCVNVKRREFDRLKAILHNCRRLGPTSQNRENHPRFREQLAGKVSFAEDIHPARGRKLRAIFDRIVW